MSAPQPLAIVADRPIAGATIILNPTDWQSHFDPETWIERWYRAGHAIMAGPDGKPFTVQNMDRDEIHAREMRAELGWLDNAARLRRYLRGFVPATPGASCGYARRWP